jgi:glycosyltransferase involved in cell wall biosynthesis
MRIACITPFYENSAVGAVAERTAQAMQRAGHDVVLVGSGRAPYRPTTLEFLGAGEFGRLDTDAMAQFEALVYNAANDPASASIFWLMERVPGIVVLHDRTYVHGYEAYTRQFLARPRRFEYLAEKYYGAAGVAFVRRFRNSQAGQDDIIRFPFLEPLLEGALAAVVHFGEFGEAVRSLVKIPVLSSSRPSYHRLAATDSRLAPERTDNRFLLAYVGHVSPYRCLPTLFAVLHDRPDLLATTRVSILGKVDDVAFAERLRQNAAELGIQDAIRWHFNASEEAKHELLSSADAAFNCRSLNSEGMSASLLEEMAYGLPVIVNAGGFAREAPDDSVCFVDTDDMRPGIENALETLLRHPSERRRIGERAAAWAATAGSTESYAENIVRLARETRGARAAKTILGRIRTTFEEMGDEPGGPAEITIRAELGARFGDNRWSDAIAPC